MCTKVRHTAPVARRLTDGQQAAARQARARRGELGLSQEELARRSHVGRRTIIDFEAGRAWPNTDTLSRLERLGLNWPVGHLTEYAAKFSDQRPSDVDEDIAAILDSTLDPDLKLRLIDRLREIRSDGEFHREHPTDRDRDVG